MKWGPGTVTFRHLKLEIGVDIDSDDDVYLMEGNTVIESCIVESPVNTAIYLMSAGSILSGSTGLDLKYCILDGMENCRRMICFQGSHPVLNIESCYINDMYSFVTVISPKEITRGVVTMADSVLYDVQVGSVCLNIAPGMINALSIVGWPEACCPP